MREEAAVWLSITLLIVLFWGDPDLHDALIQYLTGNNQ